jgi:multiple sugar transport system ATP-binding protein
MAGIQFKGVSKVFGKSVIVKKTDLEIFDGEFLVIVGPSGCGKTTTLRLIAGLEKASEGDIFIAGRQVTNLEPKERDVAMVFQNYALYPHMSVADNISFGLRLRKTCKIAIAERLKKTAKMLGLENYLKYFPRQLSGGQCQRVALGRAIIREPQVFLLDEPLSNLDAKLRIQMRTELIKLHQRLKTTIIYVTHDQTEAMTMGSRLVVMKDGIIQQIGTPQEVYKNPLNTFVAGFLGAPAMNFIACELIVNGGNVSFTTQNQEFLVKELPTETTEKLPSKVILGIRPENISIHRVKHGLECTIQIIEHVGAESIVHTSIRQGTSDIIIRYPADADLPPLGSRVWLSFDSDKIHLFDALTEENLFLSPQKEIESPLPRRIYHAG